MHSIHSNSCTGEDVGSRFSQAQSGASPSKDRSIVLEKHKEHLEKGKGVEESPLRKSRMKVCGCGCAGAGAGVAWMRGWVG